VGRTEAEDLLRQLAPQVLGALVRRYGHFDTAEDAVQEALLAAATQWPAEGLPGNPRGWLITVASRRLALAADVAVADSDDTLILLFLCCHPALSPASQVALTLRAVGGLTTAEISRVFLVPEATMTRRITRAKVQVADSGVPFRMPNGPEREQRLTVVLHVLYLIFTEGYAATSGPVLFRADLSAEAIRLTRISDNPVAALNHAVAVAMTHGPGAGLERLGRLETVRAHLLEMAGQHQAARGAYQAAAQRTMNLPRQRYLNARAARLSGHR
jgi:predicted RNA polymerase sigma factor